MQDPKPHRSLLVLTTIAALAVQPQAQHTAEPTAPFVSRFPDELPTLAGNTITPQ